MRKILISEECLSFVFQYNELVQTKFKYLVEVIGDQRINHKSIVDKLVNTKFYELRIKVENQIRVIIFTIDSKNFSESERIILLKEFLKRTNNDYKKSS